MLRRSLTLASAAALAAAALVTGPAHAAATCVVTDDEPLAGTEICVDRGGATNGSIPVPYSIGSVCVAGTCTPAVSDTIYVPRPNSGVVVAYGQVCYRPNPRLPRTCRAFNTAALIGVTIELPPIGS